MLCDEGTRKKEGKESEDESLWEELELLRHKFVVIYSQITGVTSNACKSYIFINILCNRNSHNIRPIDMGIMKTYTVTIGHLSCRGKCCIFEKK